MGQGRCRTLKRWSGCASPISSQLPAANSPAFSARGSARHSWGVALARVHCRAARPLDAPHAYVTTKTFLAHFSLDALSRLRGARGRAAAVKEKLPTDDTPAGLTGGERRQAEPGQPVRLPGYQTCYGSPAIWLILAHQVTPN